jgi:penicillin-binding protein 2
MRELLRRVRDFFSNRLVILIVIFAVLLFMLWRHLFIMQVVDPEHYISSEPDTYTSTITTQGTRGEIYDRYGRILAGNVYTWSLYYDSSNPPEDLNALCHRISSLLGKYSVTPDLPFALEYDSVQGLRFTSEYKNNAALRILFLAEMYSKSSVDLTAAEKRTEAQGAFSYMRDTLFEIPADTYSIEEMLEIMRFRYAIHINRFTTEHLIPIASRLPEEFRVTIREQQKDYPGFSCQTVESRYYPEGEAFSHILGYMGGIPETSLKEYQERGYGVDERIGRDGMEAVYESSLRGSQGRIEVVYSRLTDEEISRSTLQEPAMGNSIYLTLDKDLQNAVYSILRENVKTLLIEKITGVSDDSGSEYSAIDVLVSLINNGAVHPQRIFYSNSVYADSFTKVYEAKSASILNELRGAVMDPNYLIADYDEELMSIYNTWIETMRDAEGILSSEYRNSGIFYEQYKAGQKSAHEFLEYCIYSNYLDLEQVGLEHEMDINVIFPELINQELASLAESESYQRIVCGFILQDGLYTTRDFLLLLYDLGNLSNADGSRTRLQNGGINSEECLILKIQSNELSPSAIHLDPCSASAVITDTDTGEVLAIASYPSYDNNRFTQDSDYNQAMMEDASSPLIFRALEEDRAPGSTYKLCTSVTALECGVVTESETIYDDYRFEYVHSADKPTCFRTWSHGDINIVEAIQESCNYFYYTMGYRLCEPVEEYDYEDSTGLRKLAAYAVDLGLATKTGIELSEAEPHTSTQDAVRSAIGQGTNSFTTANINRYTSTIANNGTVIDLYIVDRILDYKGSVVFKTKPVVDHKANVSDYTFNVVQRGMAAMAQNYPNLQVFMAQSGLTIAGKTGTAQEYNDRPDHALFTSYINIDDPDITVTVTIPFGGNSVAAVRTFVDLAQYYYSIDPEETAEQITEEDLAAFE